MHLLKIKICKLIDHKTKDHCIWKSEKAVNMHLFIRKYVIYNLTIGQIKEIILH
jgi:hypothetical protein